MTKEDSRRPPRVATWLLELFSPVLQNVPLAGDLVEAFTQGRSSGWYWRQVVVAIVLAVPNFLWKQFGCLAYAACCSSVISLAWWSFHVVRNKVLLQLSVLYEKAYGMQWPWSFVYRIALDTAIPSVFQSVMIATALSVYLALFRSLTPKTLLRALPVVIVVVAIANAVWVAVLVFPSDFPVGVRVVWWAPFSAVTLVAMLLGMWKSNLSGTLRPITA